MFLCIAHAQSDCLKRLFLPDVRIYVYEAQSRFCWELIDKEAPTLYLKIINKRKRQNEYTNTHTNTRKKREENSFFSCWCFFSLLLLLSDDSTSISNGEKRIRKCEAVKTWQMEAKRKNMSMSKYHCCLSNYYKYI